MRNKGLWIGIGIVVVIAGGAAAWYLGSPLFINRMVDEDFPAAESATDEGMDEMEEMPEADMMEDDGEEMMEEDAAPTEEMMEESTDEAMMDDATEEPMMEEEASSDPTLIAMGTFSGADDFHQGSGQASLYELPDGMRVLRFEDFEVTNGPDLHVLLATGSAPTGPDDMGDSIDLGELKGNIGSQNYDIPAGVDLGLYRSVIIYCDPFHVIFATAPLN